MLHIILLTMSAVYMCVLQTIALVVTVVDLVEAADLGKLSEFIFLVL